MLCIGAILSLVPQIFKIFGYTTNKELMPLLNAGPAVVIALLVAIPFVYIFSKDKSFLKKNGG